jgi:tetratricopeptide (TPR) repeat protein
MTKLKQLNSNILWIVLLVSFASSMIYGSLERDIELGKRFLVIKKYKEALDVLKPLYNENPDNTRIQELLLEAYKGLKDYNDIVKVANAILLRNPKNTEVLLELANAHLALNNPNEAFKTIKKAVKSNPTSRQLVQKVHNLLNSRGFIDEDIEFIYDSRKRFDDKSFMALEMARLYEIKGRFDKAVNEYSLYLKRNPNKFSEVERRLEVSERTPEELIELRKSLNSLLSSGIQKWYAWRLISIVEQLMENYEKAFEAIVKAEKSRSDRSKGTLLIRFIEEMLREEQFNLVYRAASELESLPENSFTIKAPIYKAQAMRGQGRFTDAIQLLSDVLNIGNRRIADDATLILAQIYLENLKDADRAEKVIEIKYGKSARAPEVVLALRAKILLYKGNFDTAREFLLQSFKFYQKSPTLHYLFAITHFFAGSNDTADASFHTFVVNYPNDERANDALELLLLLQDAGESLPKIREALYDMFIRDTINAYEKLNNMLADTSVSRIMDIVLWKKAQCQLNLGDTTVFETLSLLASKYPESFYAPLALEKIADHMLALERTDSASELYNRIVNEYPESVNIESVRQKLRAVGRNL